MEGAGGQHGGSRGRNLSKNTGVQPKAVRNCREDGVDSLQKGKALGKFPILKCQRTFCRGRDQRANPISAVW